MRGAAGGGVLIALAVALAMASGAVIGSDMSGDVRRVLVHDCVYDGTLYGVRNLFKSIVRDDEWVTMRIRVVGKRIRILVGETLVVDYTEPDEPVRNGPRNSRSPTPGRTGPCSTTKPMRGRPAESWPTGSPWVRA